MTLIEGSTLRGFWGGGQGLAAVRDVMQWALPDLLEIEQEEYGLITGRLKAGSS